MEASTAEASKALQSAAGVGEAHMRTTSPTPPIPETVTLPPPLSARVVAAAGAASPRPTPMSDATISPVTRAVRIRSDP
jgi:hypothetical protein